MQEKKKGKQENGNEQSHGVKIKTQHDRRQLNNVIR